MTKASDNAFPSILVTEGTEPSAPAAGKQRLYIDSTTHKLKRTDSSGTDVTIEGGSVATDAIWDAAGDLAVGTGADTAAKLAKGNAGGVLAMGNGAVIWNAGTSFPASKATNDRYWRTDLGLEFYWDGTRWVTTTLYREALGTGDYTTGTFVTGNTMTRWAFTNGLGLDVWIVRVDGWTFVTTTNNGSHYWTINHNKQVAAATNTSIASFTTASDTANTITAHNATVGASVAIGTYISGNTVGTVTGSPGSIFWGFSIEYRLIGT